jgi:hypothetical protein
MRADEHDSARYDVRIQQASARQVSQHAHIADCLLASIRAEPLKIVIVDRTPKWSIAGRVPPLQLTVLCNDSPRQDRVGLCSMHRNVFSCWYHDLKMLLLDLHGSLITG